MADNTFRPFRSRDGVAGDDVDPLAGDISRDPLAELARLIGQGSRANEFDRSPRHDGTLETLDHAAPAAGGEDWEAADRDYAAPHERYAEEPYVQPRLPEPYPSDRDEAGYDDRRAPAPRYAGPAQDYDETPHAGAAYDAPYHDERYDDAGRETEAAYQPRYRDEDPRSVGRQQPPLVPQAHDDVNEAEGHWDDEHDEQADEDYADETATPPRRKGLAFVAAMLGLVLVGASGAVAYRTMFGGAILAPTLPPIIKAGDGPNKIVPKQADAQAGVNQPGAANPAAPEKLVSREEQPVAVQSPNAPPRVVSTIPVPPLGAAQTAPGGLTGPVPNVIAPAPVTAPGPAAASPRAAAPGQPAAAVPAPTTEPKKVHTVAIHPDQPGSGEAAAAAPAPAARARTPEPARSAPAPRGANAPLSLVPGAPSAAAAEPPRRREARSEAPPPSAPVATAPVAAAPAAAGGYAVQVTSQRSESEAQSAFQALQRKFPGQLGNKAPIIHRADLGDKGTYYRAMVGPYSSSEAAASFCSSLKAAGGSCLVQRN